MLRNFLTKIIGDTNAREVKRLVPIVEQINRIEQEYQQLSDNELQGKTAEFKARLAGGETLDDILPEAFAVMKNACRRLVGTKWPVRGNELTWEIIPYDVQLMGGIVLHQGKIAEMKTGEGKTLVCTLPLYLNALTGRGCHLVTANSYLARRDAEWMGGVFRFLGLTVGVVEHGLDQAARRAAYGCDITYGTNTEFGFDYLRDNMARAYEDCVQHGGRALIEGTKELHYAIVDEVDSILIDEARTPLIISAPAGESTEKYRQYCDLVKQLEPTTHYDVDEKQKTATLTESGIAKMEELLGLTNIYTEAGFNEVHHIEQALKAMAVYRRDKEYVVQGGEVMIVDEFTGRLMPGRRWGDGLHQAVEAKEAVEVKRESVTLATITLQNYFRMHSKLAGMTGTAMTEAEEFAKIYKLDIIVIPTHRAISRQDLPDSIYKSERGKYLAVAGKVKELYAKGQPVLVGTITIEKSERISELLKKEHVPHTVLNAKYHEKEAEIIAKAGEKGAVTIATNMAGRGTDIKLGAGVAELGGLAILGTERHESRRIDNQLRGRAGRQGDPGLSEFFVSMEDSLMRLFGGSTMQNLMDALKVPEDMPIQNAMISRSIESAQKKVEQHNFEIRKHLVEYDDVMNRHREIIYARRKKILTHENISDEIQKILAEEAAAFAERETTGLPVVEWDLTKIANSLNHMVGNAILPMTAEQLMLLSSTSDLTELTTKHLLAAYQHKEAGLPDAAILRHAERQIYLTTIDRLWMEHLENMHHLREKVSLRGYGQRDPLLEYKGEAYQLFTELVGNIRTNTVFGVCHVEIQLNQPTKPEPTIINLEKIVTNADAVEDILTGDRELTPDEQELFAKSTQELLQPNAAIQNLGKSGISVVRADEHDDVRVATAKNPTIIRTGSDTSTAPVADRNDPCPCGAKKPDGSPIKYKHCHGKNN